MLWIVLAVVFAAVWVYALYREDRRNPEPVWMVLLATLAGALAVPAADFVEGRMIPSPTFLNEGLAARAIAAFLVSGPVEESLKFVGVLLLVWPWTHFDEPMDGIVYAAAAGAGFALVENLLFMQDGPEVILARGPIGTGAHVLFAAFWGGALGHAGHARGPRQAGMLFLGLLLAALAHGAFNMIVFSTGEELTVSQGRALQIALVLVCLAFLRWRIRAALAERPFRFRKT
jgi:RsiW-degrading membrane proteinase PrsW (M82 family)